MLPDPFKSFELVLQTVIYTSSFFHFFSGQESVRASPVVKCITTIFMSDALISPVPMDWVSNSC